MLLVLIGLAVHMKIHVSVVSAKDRNNRKGTEVFSVFSVFSVFMCLHIRFVSFC
jgi:hypothetical protein